ncbi:bifunctional ornithine acetyltransferase/N-acetylglutamate synthase [Brachybacterium endophyticum]|uniref:Arginine biosynthesis bifunctional protein ArgJ n=1 Tax=Brachybacterium endophyticum TaxID=2182385 RepID=A0A2U2RGZ3_9MICO|nr:bifunctional glutamate N-acetyltransferase/amino-acid acetyltransferase ArgJ [Brachybacterium endophyticum]PWH05126.1 bifunctional ornithine acetyltransferase/N-acetylglutamate synthase [Brachybacterium endophyticum]
MSITFPQGFRAAGIAAGLKSSGAADLALVVSDGPLDVAAAVFTANRVQAAPVQWSRQAVADGRARAVILNSGGANACTGPDGFADTHRTAEHVGALLELSAQDVLVCSTGLIGERLPMDALLGGALTARDALEGGASAGADAARAIMTTDTVEKTATATTPSGARVGGMAKGAGMLAPQLATMLVVLTTDAVVDAATADEALRSATSTTFDRVDSDACMSTNDTVILLASGASGVETTAEELTDALRQVSSELARSLVADAEGASHDVHVVVTGAGTEGAALAVAREIARSNLVKAAIFGNDPNWGRIVAAAGCVPESVAPFDPARLGVRVNGVQVCRDGGAHEDRSTVDMTPRETLIEVDLGAGTAKGDIWTNDLTHDYVEENSAYSS